MENPEQESRAARDEIEQLREQLCREHEMYLRTAADFDNYRKRVEREIANAGRAGANVSSCCRCWKRLTASTAH